MEKIFLDTDLGYDCDDVGALSILNNFKNKGLCDIVGITHSSYFNPTGVKAIQAVNSFFKNDDIKIGYSDNTKQLNNKLVPNAYNDALINHFYKKEGKFYPSTELLLTELLKEEDNSIVYVGIGMFTNLANAYAFKNDKLNGKEILNKKIKEIVLMGGDFSTQMPEFNIKSDIESAKFLLENCPKSTYFLDFVVGASVISGTPFINDDTPVGLSYKIFSNGGRESRDPLTMLYALKHDCDLFKVSNSGKVTILDDGSTIFKEDTSYNHHLISLNKPIEEVQNRLNKYMEGNL